MNMTLLLPDGGELTWDGQWIVPVGDRGLPASVIYHHSGDEKRAGLTLRIEVVDGIPEVTEMTFTKSADGGQIRPKEVKWGAVTLDRPVTYWLSELTYQRGDEEGHDWVKRYPVSPAERRAAVAEVKRGRRPTRQRKMTPKLLREIAAAYKAASTPKHEKVAEVFGVTPRTGQRYIEKAREAGLLPPARKGTP
jgi:hypothetical protein